MATNDLLPPSFLRDAKPLADVAELSPMYTENVLVYAVTHGSESWWQWCPVKLGGGVDESRIAWSKPRGDLLPKSEWPDLSRQPGPPSQQKAWVFSPQPIMVLVQPYLPPEAK